MSKVGEIEVRRGSRYVIWVLNSVRSSRLEGVVVM